MDTIKNYEEAIRQLNDLMYFLRIMNFGDEAKQVSLAIVSTKEAFELSKTRKLSNSL